MSEHQAQADTPDQMTVVDPLDATDSTIRGTNPMSAYAAELAAALAEAPEDELQGESPALEEDADDQSESETAPPEEAEEPEEQISDEEAEEEPEAKAKDRFRFKDPEDRKVAAVAKAMGVSLAEAVQIIEGQNPTKHQEAEPEARESVADITAAIDELQDQKRKINSDLYFEAEDHKNLDQQIDALLEKRYDLKLDQALAKLSANQKDSEKFYSDYAENEAKTIKLYPSAADLKSELSKEIARLDKQMQELGDPLYHSPAKPFELAKKAAVRLGIAMTHPDEVPVSRKVTSNRPIQPASGNARTTATAPAVRQEEAIDKIRTMNDYEKLVASLTN